MRRMVPAVNQEKPMIQRVVIFDDNRLVARTLETMCEFSDTIEVRCCSESRTFFEILDTWNPSHLLLDLSMPEMDGIEVMQALKSRRHQLGIVIISGMGPRIIESARTFAREHGLRVLGVLEKPVAPKQLREFLERDMTQEMLAPVHLPGGVRNEGIKITEADVRKAMRSEAIVPHYQPKVDCMSTTLAGVEVLARWTHPVVGDIPPEVFVPIIERCGMVEDLTQQLAVKAVDWFANCYGYGFGLTLAFNVSCASLRTGELIRLLRKRTSHFGLDPRRVVFELTESSVMADPIEALGTFTRVRTAGFELALDGFGTGYSSMEQLVRLPFSEIKIDKLFARAVRTSPNALAAMKCMIDLANNLDMYVTAEGVDDLETFLILQRLGCSFTQGCFIAEALAEEEVRGWVDRWNTVRVENWQPRETTAA